MIIIKDRKKPISALKTIHNNNHTRVFNKCALSTYHYNKLNFDIGIPITKINAGLYEITIDNVSYMIHVYYSIDGDGYLEINGVNDIKIVIANMIHNIIPYKITRRNNEIKSVTDKMVNSKVSIIQLFGNTTITGTPSLTTPATIKNIDSIILNNKCNTNTDYFKYDLPSNIVCSSLPNGVRDELIFDFEKKYIHIINKCMKDTLHTYDWDWVKELSNDKSFVFFTNIENIKRNNLNNNIICSHFKTVSYSELVNKTNNTNCIAVTDETQSNNSGIWIRILKTDLDFHGKDEDCIIVFNEWLSNKKKTDPIKIQYELNNYKDMELHPDDYDINTYYGNNTITSNVPISICYKSI